MALLFKNGKSRNIKNLGWLLRNWKMVDSFRISRNPHLPAGECTLQAYMRDGSEYLCGFASYDVCKEWLKRPIFVSVEVNDAIVKTTYKITNRRRTK